MSIRRILFIVLAICISGATVFLGRSWLAQQHEVVAAAPVAKTGVNVLVAKGNLAAGQFVRPDNLRWQSWPEADVPSTYMVEGKAKLEDFVGAVVRSGINDGEPLVEGRVVRPGDRGFMAAVLTPGYRAVTVTVTVSTGLAGFVFPGDRVDLILTLAVPSEDGKEHRASETILTDLRVLAVDQRADDQNKEVVVAKSATLEVTPKEAEAISVAVELGKLSLSLRSLAVATGTDPVRKFSHTWDSDASRLIPPPIPVQSATSNLTVTIIRGSASTDMQFSKDGKPATPKDGKPPGAPTVSASISKDGK